MGTRNVKGDAGAFSPGVLVLTPSLVPGIDGPGSLGQRPGKLGNRSHLLERKAKKK